MKVFKTIQVTCYNWDTDYNSFNWEPDFMTIFVTWQSWVTVDSIRSSCNVLSGKYKKMEPRKNCESGQEVTTKSECEKAAKELGMTFRLDGSWSLAQRYCLILKNRVYFKRKTGKAPDSMEHARYRAICVENSGEPSFRIIWKFLKIWRRAIFSVKFEHWKFLKLYKDWKNLKL